MHALPLLLLLLGCGAQAPKEPTMRDNPVHYFEIPVTDLERAVRFYEAVFGHQLTRRTVDGYDMALFPAAEGAPGASGALAKGDVYVPAKAGPILYFSVDDIDPVLARATAEGAAILYPKKAVGDIGFVAEIEDSEGNRIALHATRD
jgi:hypothetical protein